ncbi:MAG: hypothetical protein AB1673_07010 [Actinomycetota bacterium]|jgi:hypothetical protein
MSAPDYVPPTTADKPRSSLALPPPGRWTASRPADLVGGQPTGQRLGRPGPDQGYVLVLVSQFEDRLRLAPGEHRSDVVDGVMAVALRRASMFGRAPVNHDLELAFGMFGFLDDPDSLPPDLVDWRAKAFRGASHDYWERRAIADRVPAGTLRVTPAEARARLGDWRSLVGAGQ